MKLTECNDLIPIWKPSGERQQQKEQQMVILVHISICKEKTMFCSVHVKRIWEASQSSIKAVFRLHPRMPKQGCIKYNLNNVTVRFKINHRRLVRERNKNMANKDGIFIATQSSS